MKLKKTILRPYRRFDKNLYNPPVEYLTKRQAEKIRNSNPLLKNLHPEPTRGIVRFEVTDDLYYYVGESRCVSKDIFNRKFGSKIAFARLLKNIQDNEDSILIPKILRHNSVGSNLKQQFVERSAAYND